MAASTVRKLREQIEHLETNCGNKQDRIFELTDEVDDLKSKNSELERAQLEHDGDIAKLFEKIRRLEAHEVQIDISAIPEIESAEQRTYGAWADVPEAETRKSTYFSVRGRKVTSWFQCPDGGYQIEIKSAP